MTMVSEAGLSVHMATPRPYLLPALEVLFKRLASAEKPVGQSSAEIVLGALTPFQKAFADPEQILAAPYGPLTLGLDPESIPFEIRPPRKPAPTSRGLSGSSYGDNYRYGDYGLVARERPAWARKRRG